MGAVGADVLLNLKLELLRNLFLFGFDCLQKEQQQQHNNIISKSIALAPIDIAVTSHVSGPSFSAFDA